MKKILRVVYICFAAVLCFLVYIMAYQSGAANNFMSLAEEATNGETVKDKVIGVSKITSSLFYSDLIEEINSENVKGGMLPSCAETTYKTYEVTESTSTEKSSVTKLDKCYIFTIFELNNFVTTQLENGTNQFGIKFTNDSNNEYTYYFNVSSSLNSSFYSEKPTNDKDAILKAQRSTEVMSTNFKFISTIITESMISCIKDELGITTGGFSSVDLIDARGNSKYTFTSNFDFVGDFFTEVEPLIAKFDVAKSLSDNKDAAAEEKTAAVNEYKNAYDTMYAKTKEEGSKYVAGYTSDAFYPSSLIWSSIGITALFLLCAVIIYMLLFHFVFIKNLVTRRGGKEKNNYSVKKGYQKTSNSKAKPEVEKDPTKIEIIDIPTEEVSSEDDKESK